MILLRHILRGFFFLLVVLPARSVDETAHIRACSELNCERAVVAGDDGLDHGRVDRCVREGRAEGVVRGIP